MTHPSFTQTLPVWGRIGVLSFGGPAAQISLMHREIVEDRNWMSEREYLNALAFCMLLPGPEAMQLATYSGWRLHGIRGGLAAGLLFVLPGAAVILALAAVYLLYGAVPTSVHHLGRHPDALRALGGEAQRRDCFGAERRIGPQRRKHLR